MSMQSNQSALNSHYLSSILPYDNNMNKPEQFLKTKQFYKPEQFIWNNPHRTSRKMYPYYHQINQEYSQKVKPIIDQLQQQDRINTEKQRIKKLTELRQNTRNKFFSRQKQRQQLESKAHLTARNKQYISLEKLPRNSEKSIFPHSQYMNRKLTPVQFKTNDNIKARALTGPIQSTTNMMITSTYKKSIQTYDMRLIQIRNMVHNQLSQNQQKIKQSFAKRRLQNHKYYHKKQSNRESLNFNN